MGGEIAGAEDVSVLSFSVHGTQLSKYKPQTRDAG
jgi:hypothetical protein